MDTDTDNTNLCYMLPIELSWRMQALSPRLRIQAQGSLAAECAAVEARFELKLQALERRDRRDKRKCRTTRISLADTFLGKQSRLVERVVDRADREGDYEVLQALDAVASLVEVKGHVTRASLLVPYIDTPASSGQPAYWEGFTPDDQPTPDPTVTAPAVAAMNVDGAPHRDQLVLRHHSGDLIPIDEENDGFETAVEMPQDVVWPGPIAPQHEFEYYDRSRST